VGNKGKTPFICLTGDILRIMQDKLNANATNGNVNSTSAETLKRIFETVVGKRGYLLELTGGLDASMEIPEGGGMTIRGLLSKAIPITFATKTTKSKVCEFMVNVWAVLQVVITNVSIGRDVRHNLQQYLDLLTRIEAVARREISEANEQDKTAKSLKLPGQAMERMYLQIVDQSLRSGSRRVQSVATPFLMSHHSTRIMHVRTRWWLASGKRIIV
jgi:hypothetical protein